MKIVKAKVQDIPLIQKIAEKSWRSHYPGIISHEQIEYMLEQMYSKSELKKHFENPNYHYYLIQEDDQFLGFVGFEFHLEPETTKLHRIYFLKEAQGKGFGKKALKLVVNETKKIDNKRVILTVNKNNSAKKFYESQGFKIYDEAISDIGNGYVMDDFLMEFIL